MNLLKTMQSHPAVAGVTAIVAGVAAFAGITLAWGPTRPTYTMERPADHVTFDSITNNPNYGDEREFVTIKDVTTGGKLTNNATLIPGHEYQVQVYVHNNASSDLNASGVGIAHGTTVRAALPASVNGSETVDGFVTATNATPTEVYDTAALTSTGKVDLEFVNGSAMLHTNFQQTKLADSVITTGVKVGDKDLSGDWRGCLNYAGAVTFNFKVKNLPTGDFTMDKQVRKHSTTTGGWLDTYAAQPGETVDYIIRYKNTGTITQDNVVVKDMLPAGVSYIAGSTVLANANNPTGKVINDDVTTKGVNIGSYTPGSNAWVRFSAQVAANDSLAVCGANTLKNVASVTTGAGTKSDGADVTVTKTCQPPVDKDVTVCSITTGKIVTIKESVQKAHPELYADKDSDKCKITVCELSSKKVITISKEQYNTHTNLYTDQNSAVCHPATPTTPTTPAPAAELPKTGLGLDALSLAGAGALAYAGYAYLASRRA